MSGPEVLSTTVSSTLHGDHTVEVERSIPHLSDRSRWITPSPSSLSSYSTSTVKIMKYLISRSIIETTCGFFRFSIELLTDLLTLLRSFFCDLRLMTPILGSTLLSPSTYFSHLHTEWVYKGPYYNISHFRTFPLESSWVFSWGPLFQLNTYGLYFDGRQVNVVSLFRYRKEKVRKICRLSLWSPNQDVSIVLVQMYFKK